ncbi:hypothetical protein MSAS_47440 [Mycobacterium saskatchewanense]|nr:hypothetical protein MSAS_47440 [Mycobacterium saskatchewanense]
METRDAEALRPFLAENATYQNVGMPASIGLQAVLDDLGGQFAAFPDSYAYEIINIAANGPVVLTERIDYVRTPTGELAGIPVMGTFAVDAGKITRWTDYWDTALLAKVFAGDDVHVLLPKVAG